MLDYIPAQFRVRVIRRPRYGCRACENAVVQAPAPDRPIDGGMATEALVAQVLIGKYCDHLPLYRQSQIFARQGINLDRSTLCNWVGRACWWLAPLHELMLSTVLSSPKVFADDTTLPVLDPGNGRTKTGRLWCYAVDNRPWQGPGHPVAAYIYSEDRKAEHPAIHLKGFRGLLQVDGWNDDCHAHAEWRPKFRFPMRMAASSCAPSSSDAPSFVLPSTMCGSIGKTASLKVVRKRRTWPMTKVWRSGRYRQKAPSRSTCRSRESDQSKTSLPH